MRLISSVGLIIVQSNVLAKLTLKLVNVGQIVRIGQEGRRLGAERLAVAPANRQTLPFSFYGPTHTDAFGLILHRPALRPAPRLGTPLRDEVRSVGL